MPETQAVSIHAVFRNLSAATAFLAVVTARAEPFDWARYQPIVDRAPFGPIYNEAMAAEEAARLQAAQEAPPAPEGPLLSETVKVSAITVFGGVPAAGFTDTSEGKSYYLYLGKSAGDFTLVDVMPDVKAVRLRKGEQEETLFLNNPVSNANADNAGSQSTAPTAAAKPTPRIPARTQGYAELQRKRAEAEEARRVAREKAEAERQKRIEELERMTPEERDRDLRDKNIEIIVSGDGPPLPIELNRTDLEILAEKGFDVTDAMQALEEKEAADAAEPASERIRRIRERREAARKRREQEQQGGGANPPAP
jgi:hypothetical protein